MGKRYIYITGASRGIGKGLAEACLQNSEVEVIGISRSNTIQEENYSFVELDLSDLNAVKSFEFSDHSDADHIVLVNNAALLGEIRYLGNMNNDELEDLFNVNLTAAAILCNKFLKKYKNLSCDKQIINISSGAATSAYDGWASYCTTKAGLDMLTRAIDVEQQFVDENIRFKAYAIAPGVVDTNMQTQIRNSSGEEFSMIDKFHDLLNNGELYDANKVGSVLWEMIQDNSKIPDVISRIRL